MSGNQLALDSTLDVFGQLVRTPCDQARLLLRVLRSPAVLAGRLRDTAHGLTALAEDFTPTVPTALFGPTGRARRYAFARLPLADITAIGKASSVTVNDVYLAAVTGRVPQSSSHLGMRSGTLPVSMPWHPSAQLPHGAPSSVVCPRVPVRGRTGRTERECEPATPTTIR